MEDLEDLFRPLTGTENTWYDALTDEQQAWIKGLAELARKHGKLPVGDRTAERFAQKFPNAKRPAGSTIRETVKRLVRV